MSGQRISTSSQPFTSPIPLPDSSLFDMRVFSDKRSTSKIRPPSPPTKSPPYSRVSLYSSGKSGSFGPATAQTPQHWGHARTPSTGGSMSSLYKEKFEEIELIGRGSFGEVFKVLDKDKKRHFAIKKLKKLADRKRAMGEAFVGCSLPEHPNCVKYINAWEEDYALYIQTELCYGSLKDYIDTKDVIPEEEIWNFILDITLGLKHIHDNKLIHLDIKPGNILFSKDKRTLKIGDFGLTSHRRATLDDEGDCLYVAPEIFEGKYSPALDIFSLGATVFEIATNVCMPSNGKLWQDLRSGASFSLAPEAPQRSPELEELVRQMMERNPAKRITIDEILNHPILRSLNRKRLYVEEEEESDEEQDQRIKISRSAFKKEQREELRRQSLEAMQGRRLDEEMDTDDEFRQPLFDDDDEDEDDVMIMSNENFDAIYSISPVNLLRRFDQVHD